MQQVIVIDIRSSADADGLHDMQQM